MSVGLGVGGLGLTNQALSGSLVPPATGKGVAKCFPALPSPPKAWCVLAL